MIHPFSPVPPSIQSCCEKTTGNVGSPVSMQRVSRSLHR
jgi:hypothetical protein